MCHSASTSQYHQLDCRDPHDTIVITSAFCLYLYVIRHGGWNHHMRYQSIIWTGLPGVYWHLPMPQLNWNWKPSVLSHPDLRRAIYKIYIVISLDFRHDSVNMITKQIRVTV